jgi:hypothetical protein
MNPLSPISLSKEGGSDHPWSKTFFALCLFTFAFYDAAFAIAANF